MQTNNLKKPEFKDRNINFKVNENELMKIRENAKKYTEGNISRWIRYAAIKLEPKSEDIQG